MRILILSYNVDSSITAYVYGQYILKCNHVRIMLTVLCTMNQDMNCIYNTGNTIKLVLNSIWMAHLRQNTFEIYVAKYQ